MATYCVAYELDFDQIIEDPLAIVIDEDLEKRLDITLTTM